MVAAALLGVGVSRAPQAKAANLYWDNDADSANNSISTGAGLGGTGSWDTSAAKWFDGTNGLAWTNSSQDVAYFTGTAGTVTLTEPITIGGLVFSGTDFTVAGQTLTLASGSGAPAISLTNGNTATISSVVAGTNGFIKTGNGLLRLTNGSNTYSGTTTIEGGSLLISAASQLGADTSAVVVTAGNGMPSNTTLVGFSGGSLVLDGLLAGFELARALNLEGRGPIGNNGAALLSVGNNTLSGLITSSASTQTPATFRNTRITSANGLLTMSGGLVVQGVAGSAFTTLGGVNQGGVSSYNLTGALTGTGTLQKVGVGTLVLSPSDTSGFSGRIRLSGSAANGQSTVRVFSADAFGTANAGTTSATIDMDGGVLEVYSDAGLNFAKNAYARASSTFFASNTIGGSAVNGTSAFGNLSYEDNITLTFGARNGHGLSFTTAPVNGGDSNSTFTNNMAGRLSFSGAFWSNADAGAARTLLFNGNGVTSINGGIIAAGGASFDHVLTKQGSGLLTITGTNSTLDGAVNSHGGAIAITDFRSLNNSSTAAINIGSGGTGSGLIIGTDVAATAAGLITSRPVNLSGSTGAPSIYANQAGANPVVFNGEFSTTAGSTTEAKTLTLGGTNTADNVINTSLDNQASVTTGNLALAKIGSGTWVLAGANTYTGLTTIVNGTLKIKANAAISTVLPAANDITFGNNNVYAGGTLEFVGQPGINNVQTLDVLTSTSGAATIRLTPGAGGTASLTFASQTTGAGGSVNFVGADFVSNKITITGGNGLVSRTNYWNGADFAYRESNVLRAPVYGTDSGFVTSATALTASANMQVTGSFAANTVSISTLKVAGSHTLTLNAAQTVTLSNGGVLVTGGDAVITGGAALALGTQALVVRTDLPTDTLSIQSVITGSGGLTKGGAGTLILAAANTQTGTISINEGTVRLSGSGRLGATSQGLTMRQGTVLDLNGVTPSTNTDAFNSNGSVTSATPATFTVGANNGTGSSFGTVDGAVSLTKLGTGAQSWLGNSSYTGVTTIGSTGLVTVETLADIGQNSGIGRGDPTSDATNAASLVFNGSTGGISYRGDSMVGLLSLGSLSASTNRLFTLAGTGATLASSQTTNINNAVVWRNTGAIVHGIVGPQAIVFSGSSQGDNRFNPQLTDSGIGANVTSLTKTGTGVWHLGAAANTYSGPTLITQGILGATNGQGLSPNSNLQFDGGALYSQGLLNRNIGTGAGEMRFLAAAANTAQFSGGFLGGDSKLTVSWDGTPIWGSTVGFIGARDGFILNSSQARGQGTTGSIALSEVEIAGDFSLGSAPVTGGSGLSFTLAQNSATVSGLASTAGYYVGQSITGTNVPSGAYVASINSASQITISANTANAGGIAGTYADGAFIVSPLRPIRVEDNGNTGADFATISGAISAGDALTGLRKLGGGTLRLTGANTYQGETSVYQGALVVRSLGSSLSAASTPTSVGLSGSDVIFGNANAVTIGNGGTGGAILQYVGPGETTDRKIRLNTTTGGAQLHADGSGAWVLTNVANDMAAGIKTLNLRGTNAAANLITSQLSDNGGALAVTVDGGATWVLTNGTNNYTGLTLVSAGALGIGHNTAIGGAIQNSNGNIFAYGGDRSVANVLTLNNNTASGFQGDHNLAFTNAVVVGASANNVTLANSIAAGKSLTFGAGVTANSLTDNRAWVFEGGGETVINGNITTSTRRWLRLDINSGAQLTLGTSGANSNFSQGAATAIDVDSGTLKFTSDNALPSLSASSLTTTSGTAIAATTYTVPSTAGLTVGQLFTGTNVPDNSRILSIDSATTFTTSVAPTTAVASGATLNFAGSGGLLLSPEVATADTATVDFNGTTQTITSLTATTNGTLRLDNTSSSPAAFRFGAGNAAINFGSGLGSYSVLNTGAGALSLVKLGNSAVTFNSGITLANKGEIAAEGGSFTITGQATAASGLRAIGSSTLTLTGGITNPGLMRSVEVGAGSTLTLLDGAGSAFTGLTALRLGNTGTGTATLNLNVGTGATDTFALTAGGTLALGGTVTFNLTDAGLDENTTYTLLNLADGGITAFGAANMVQGAMPGGFDALTWSVTDNQVALTTGNLITGSLYWRGLTSAAWNGAANNWSTDKAGTVASTTFPGAGTDVIFSHDGASGVLTTTLEQNYRLNSLTFESGTTTPTSVTISPGTNTTSRLEVSDHITLSAGAPASVTLATNYKIGAAQTWTVTDAATTLTFSGALLGVADVTKAGLGKVVLTAVADPTFNAAKTFDLTIGAGNFEVQNVGSLGTVVNDNLANIIINGGAFYFANATGSTLPNPITLAGGSLSGAGTNHTYSGPVVVFSASTVNLADSNGPATNAARNITLSGALTGAGSLTVDSSSSVSSGNQVGGTLTLNNAASSWTGALIVNRGTVTVASTSSPSWTGNDVTFSAFGRLILQGVNAQTLTRTGALALSASAIAEFQIDNVSGTLASDFTVDQTSPLSLGNAAALRIFLADSASKLSLSGGVVLGGNASISSSGDAAGVVTISGVISESSANTGLTFHDDAGGWNQGNRLVRLTGANTFTGGLTLADGILEFSTVSNVGGGASNLGQGSAINLSGGNLRFIGSTSQTTNRPLTFAAGATLSAAGTDGAVITFAGPVDVSARTADGSAFTLSGIAGSTGVITSDIATTGDVADFTVNGGRWILRGAGSRIGDDMTVTGDGTVLDLDAGQLKVRDDLTVTANAVLNLGSAGVLSFSTPTLSADASLRAVSGGTIALGVDGSIVTTDFDAMRIGTDGVGVGTLATGTFTQTVAEFILGNRNTDRSGLVTGTGQITVTSNIDLYGGTIYAGLASTGAVSLDKLSMNTVTLAGDNSGLLGTGSTIVYEGALILDYSVSTATKLRAASALEMRGASLSLSGNTSAAVAQSVGSFTLGNGGSAVITLNPAGGQDLLLSLGAITRALNAQDGTLRINLPAGTQGATHGVTTTTALTGGVVGAGGYITVDDGTGVWFATKSGDNIVALASTAKNVVTTWTSGGHVTDTGSGYTGTILGAYPGSVRFDAVPGSEVDVAAAGALGIATGGILVTSNVGSPASLSGGTLFSGAQTGNVPELIVTQDSAAVFEIGSALRVNTALTKAGAGTLRLSGANTYTGYTEVQNGVLQVSGGNAIGDTSVVTLSGSRNTTLQLLANETIGRLQGGSRQQDQDLGVVAIGANTLTIDHFSGTAATYDGIFTGNGTIIRNGTSGVGNFLLRGVSGSNFTGSLVLNGGLTYLEVSGTMNAASITINRGASFLISNNGTTRTGARLPDAMPMTLNSADGSWNGETRPSGLAIRIDQNAVTNETIGVLTFASGASYFRGDASGTTGRSGIIAADFVRSNNATLAARARNLGQLAGNRAFLRIVSGSANETAFRTSLVGGGGAAASKTISILPWAIGQTQDASVTDDIMGNTLVTYDALAGDGAGIRPLDLTTEYVTFATKTVNTENIRASLTADLTDLAGQTINALVVNNANTTAGTVAITGAGADQTLAITSGAMLFTATGATSGTPAMGVTLGGFDGGVTVGGTNEYVVFVQNPTSAEVGGSVTATISSPLTSAADITKSGRGTLVLSAVNVAGGGARRTTVNEGVLEISDLDGIGGATGALVLAGGTLRLGAGFTDDLSSRTLSILTGGGTLDTNGIDLALAGSLGSGAGGFTKAGAGTLTLNAAATYAGGTTVTGGTLTVGANDAIGTGGPLAVGAGAAFDVGAFAVSVSRLSTAGASPAILGSGTITAAEGFVFNHTGDITVSAILAGPSGLSKSQSSVLTLDGTNAYTGITEVTAGTLVISTLANVGGGASSLGAPVDADAGMIRMGLSTNGATLRYVGSGHASDRLIGLQGTTGTITLDARGTGALGLGGVRMVNPGDRTLVLRGTSASSVVNTLGAVQQLGGVLTLNKTDASTWQLSAANSYAGATQVDNGTLRLGVADALPATTALRLGTGSTAGTLDLNGFSQSIGSLSVASTSNAVTNTISVAAGKTLTVSGAVTLGANADNSKTTVTIGGGGSLVVNSGGAAFQVGGATGGTNDNLVNADLSGLLSFQADLGSGILRVGDGNSGTELNGSTLRLAVSNTITASSVRVGDGSGGSATHYLILGSGANVLQTDTLNVGSAGTGVRSGGSVAFAAGDTTGTFTLRAADGASRTTVNLISTSGNTAGNMDSVLDFSGHQADLLVGNLTMSARSANTGAATSALTFTQGALDVTSLLMASRTGSGSGNATATMNLGGGAVALGTVAMAVNTSAGGTVAATLNVTGGTVTIGTGTGTAVNMANAAAGRTATSNLNVTGGIVALAGDIVRTGGAGTESATLTLDGGTLDLNAFAFGSASAPVVLDARAGTLRDAGTLNGTGGLTKTGAGLLTIEGASAFTGATTVSEGTLQIAAESGLGAVPGAFTAGHLTLGGASSQGILKTTATIALSANRGVTLAAGGGAFDVAASTTLTIGSVVTGTGALTKSGAGLLNLKMGTPQYSGTTTIDGGTLRFTNVADLATVNTTAFNINNGATLEFQSSVGGNNRTVINNKTFTFGVSGGGTIHFNGGNHLMQSGVHTFVTTGGSKNVISQTNDGYINNQGSGNTVFDVADGTDGVDLELSVRWSNGTLSKQGLGTMAITGVHGGDYALDIVAGVLEVGGASSLNGGTFTAAIANEGTFRYVSSAAQTISGVISGAGAVTQGGSGTLELSGANTFTGATLVSAGTLTAGAGALAGTSGITVNGAILAATDYNLAATLTLDAAATASISAADLTITGAISNAGTTDDALDFTAATGKITLTSLAGAGKTRFGADADVLGGIAEGMVTVVGALGADITGGTVNAASLTGNVSGGVVTVTGQLTGEITAGTNSLGSLSSASVTGGTNTITGAAAVTTVSGGTTTVGGVAAVTTLTAGTLNLNGATASIGTLTDGTINLGTTALTVDSGTFIGLLAGANGSLIKATSGTLTISGANTFGGGTTVSAGTLILGNVTALGTGSITVASGATLNLNSLGVSNAITVAAGATITGGPTAASVDTTGPSTVVNTVLTGTGGLEKTDGGELTLTTPNFFTGAVEANVAGAVIKAAFLSDTSSSLGASALDNPANLVLGSGATLEFTGSSDAVTSRSFTLDGSAGIAATGNGALVFTADSKIALVGAEPLLTLTASNTGTNIFRASLTDADIAAGNGIKNLVIDGTGTWVIGGAANRFKNDVRLEAAAGATIGLESGALPAGATIAVANGTTLRWEGGNTNDLSSKLDIAAGATAKLDLGSNNVTFAAVPTLGAGASLEKQGTGKLNISAAFSAPTLNVAVSAGTLAVNGVLGNITLTSGARLGGTGTLGTATVGTGAILAPGNSPGTLNATDLVLTGGSVFEWEVQDATSSTGYDKINLTGNLDLTGANPGSKVSFKIISRLGAGDGNTAGDPLNFGPPNGVSSIRTFNFGVVGGVLLNSGQNISDVFEFDLTEFTYSDGSASNAGLWSIAWDGGSAITLTAVPEPSTYGFGLGALALAAAAIRRRKRQAKA
jgi:autotransporter-associated beta strand protein